MISSEELYNQHIQEMFGTTSIEDLTESETDRRLNRLLLCLPNNGKLYKYRSIDGDAFKNAYDGLEKGYLYMAKASTLNDDMDSVLTFDPEIEVIKTADYFFDNPWLFLEEWIRANPDKRIFRNLYDRYTYDKLLSCVDRKNFIMDYSKAVSLLMSEGVSEEQAREYISKIEKYIHDLIEQSKERVELSTSNFVNFNRINRENIYVFSMTEDYDSNAMWGLYANSNKGFCIEYDYQKAKTFSVDLKKKIINTYKVIYRETLEEFSFLDMHKYVLTGKTNQELLKKANMDMLSKLITKQIDWKYEKEWRIFLCNLDNENKIYADMVSGIIIDERALKETNTTLLIDLAESKDWTIKIRKSNKSATGHIYEEYKH